MKKLLLILLFVPLVSFGQTKIGFKAQEVEGLNPSEVT